MILVLHIDQLQMVMIMGDFSRLAFNMFFFNDR